MGGGIYAIILCCVMLFLRCWSYIKKTFDYEEEEKEFYFQPKFMIVKCDCVCGKCHADWVYQSRIKKKNVFMFLRIIQILDLTRWVKKKILIYI